MKKLIIMTVTFIMALGIGLSSAQNVGNLASNSVKKDKKTVESEVVKTTQNKSIEVKQEKRIKLLNEEFEFYNYGTYLTNFNRIATNKKPVMLWRKEGC